MNVEAPLHPAVARRRLIAERQVRSPIWRTIHVLGSLNFALVLLAVIAIACGAATFAESNFSTKIARAYFYRNPLFFGWLALLCVNLFAVTLTRWPWEKKHIGFVVTHYGIITLLAGAIIGMATGFEGNVTLRSDAPPVTRVTTSRSIIQLENPAEPALYITDFDPETTRPSAKRPREFRVPGTDRRVIADDFSPNLVHVETLVAASPAEAGPAILMRFASQTAGRTLEMPFQLSGSGETERDFFGLARIVFAREPVAAPPADATQTVMIFSKYAPVGAPGTAAAGIDVRLSEDGRKVTILSTATGVATTYLRSEIMGVAVPVGNASFTIEEYWPDFAMENGRPVTKSDEPKNPAALVRIAVPVGDGKPELRLMPNGDGIAYQLLRNGRIAASGTAAPGDSFALGWADWSAEVVQSLPHATVHTEVQPGPELPKGTHGVPGFRAHLAGPNGARGPDRWIESGQITTLTDGTYDIRIGFGLETKPLPFSIRLVNFEVPRDEGTDAPADFRATVEFRDLQTGATKSGVARMNHPASYPGTLWANVSGLNYKFSQAEWNPRDLAETTLQVLHDPGWMLKWIGSLGICVGIAIMFYWKPRSA